MNKLLGIGLAFSLTTTLILAGVLSDKDSQDVHVNPHNRQSVTLRIENSCPNNPGNIAPPPIVNGKG